MSRPHHTPIAPPPYWQDACRDLARRDPVIARLIREHPGEAVRGSGDPFRTLLNAIVGQQISVAAADGIWARLLEAFPRFTPRTIAAAEPARLREVGLSARKAEYAVGAATAFSDGRVDPGRWPGMSDDELRSELTALRGVGPWTADMMLIFSAHRPDVLPLGDIGLLNAAARLYGWTGDATTAAEKRRRLREHAETWQPWRTVGTWYVWCDLDEETVIY
ncbi:MAG: DNA-3-methyladenine glycosylase family protein [Spirochaetota bacterium]